MCAILVIRPVTPRMLCGLCDSFGFCSGADRAGIGLDTFFKMGGRLGHNTVIPCAILGLSFIADAGSGMALVIVVIGPVTPLVVFQSGLRFNFHITAISTGEMDLTRCQMGSPIDHYAVIKIVAFCLRFIATAGTDVGSLIILPPITPAVYVLQLGYRLSLGMSAFGAGVGSDTLCLLSRRGCNHAVIPVVDICTNAIANRAGFLVGSIAIGCPDAPLMIFDLSCSSAISLTNAGVGISGCVCAIVSPVGPVMTKAFHILSFCCAAVSTGVGHDTAVRAGRRLALFTLVPTVVFCFALAACTAVGVGSFVLVRLPVTKFTSMISDRFRCVEIGGQQSGAVGHDLAVFPLPFRQAHNGHVSFALRIGELSKLKCCAIIIIGPAANKQSRPIFVKADLPVLIIQNAGALMIAVEAVLHHEMFFTVGPQISAIGDPIVGYPGCTNAFGFDIDVVFLCIIYKVFLKGGSATPHARGHHLELHSTFINDGDRAVVGNVYLSKVRSRIKLLVRCIRQRFVDPEVVIFCDFLVKILVFKIIQHAVSVCIRRLNAIGNTVSVGIDHE